jgi:hypothetical protein
VIGDVQAHRLNRTTAHLGRTNTRSARAPAP